VERVDQTLGNMIRTYELENFESDYNDLWSQILANCAWAIGSTAYSILDATPAQIVFGRDMLFDLSFTTNYNELKNKKQKASDLNVYRKNTKRINMIVKLMIKSYWIVEHCKESKFQIVMDLTKSLDCIQTLPLKVVRASMYNKC
jgi:hypothetical protein